MKTYQLPGFKLEFSDLSQTLFSDGDLNSNTLYSRARQSLNEKFNQKKIGFYDWPETLSNEEVLKILSIAKELRSRFEGVLICGIGGSHLGAAAVIEALRSEEEESRFPFFWLNNVDRWSVERATHFVKQRKVATLLISKSGNTTETLSGFFHLSPFLDPKGIVIITDPETGELRRWVNQHKYSHLPVPPNIGGRFSVLTAVGLLPIALSGINIHDLIDGARNLKAKLDQTSVEDNPAFPYAMTSYGWDKNRGHHTQYLMPYQSNLKLLTDWYVQLWAESLGKKDKAGKAVGPTFVGALGSRDQHSLLQLFKEGPNNKLVGFIDVESSSLPLKVGSAPVPSPAFEYLCQHTFEEINSKALAATAKSLDSSGVPTYRFIFNELSPKSLGSFILFQQLACAIAGELYQVNAFDQPGVEEAKRLLRQSL